MLYHIVAFGLGWILDLIIGDPTNFPHPIRLIGNLIHKLDLALLGEKLPPKRDRKKEFFKGVLLVIITLLLTIAVAGLVLLGAYKINLWLGVALETALTCYILAARSLQVESGRVKTALEKEGLDAGRKAVSMIVGRDTASLDEAGVIRAAVETVAENTSDGVIAPLIYTFIGGPVLGFAYKAVNTMDSMVGYHNDRYENFGTCAAKLDDIVNFLPARISAILMVLAAGLLGKEYSGKDALRIFKRDRYKHKSPNSAQTESACAGALGLRLAGDAYYFGKLVKKPFIGDAKREIEREDIKRSARLMFATEFLAVALCMLIGISFLV